MYMSIGVLRLIGSHA